MGFHLRGFHSAESYCSQVVENSTQAPELCQSLPFPTCVGRALSLIGLFSREGWQEIEKKIGFVAILPQSYRKKAFCLCSLLRVEFGDKCHNKVCSNFRTGPV